MSLTLIRLPYRYGSDQLMFFFCLVQSQQSDVFIEEEEGFTDIKLAMQSFSLSLNKEEYPLAKARISNLSCDLGLRGSNQEINGSIGRLTLMDMSPKGALYKEK